MDDDVIQDILFEVRSFMKEELPNTLQEGNYVMKGSTTYFLKRNAFFRPNITIPSDLKNAVDKQQISLHHLPKKYIREYLSIHATTNSYNIVCRVELCKINGKTVCDDTFVYTVDAQNKNAIAD